MAAKGSLGSIVLEILIILMALILVAVILIPNRIWKEENKITTTCQSNLNSLYEAEQFYRRSNGMFTDSLSKLLNFVQTDSGLQQRQSLVSLTRSYVRVIDNILEISTVEQITNISQSAFEITGDLVGNDRYFRKEEGLLDSSQALIREISRLDSNQSFPNFSRAKLFVDSLQNLRESISDYTLQNGILQAINYTDSIKVYLNRIEMNEVNRYWNNLNRKMNNFIKAVNKTDIVKVSTVSDRLQKFLERINRSMKNLNQASIEKDLRKIQAEHQNLTELHQRFLSPEYFILTQRYGLSALNETDSILINLDQHDFYCPDNGDTYLIDTTSSKMLTVECPNLLDRFHKQFQEDIAPIRNLPIFSQIEQLDTVLQRTLAVMNDNRIYIRRNTDLLLNLKEIIAEMDEIDEVFFYRFVHHLKEFLNLIDHEKKLSVLKPAIEDILNPMDTLATRIENKNVEDLRQRLQSYKESLAELDSAISEARLPSSARRNIKSDVEAIAPALDIVSDMNNGFNNSYADALRGASKDLEKTLLHALEGVNERVYVIFYKTHINHGYIRDGEKSWEQK